MKTNKKLLAAALMMLTGAFSSTSNAANSATGDATAALVTPMTVAMTSATMNFGVFEDAGAGGTVVLDPALATANLSSTGAITILGSTTGSRILYDVTRGGSAAYSLTISGAAILTDGGGLNPLNMSVDTSALTCTAGCTADYTGEALGGTLTIPAAHPAGSYSTGNGGTASQITVTANYD